MTRLLPLVLLALALNGCSTLPGEEDNQRRLERAIADSLKGPRSREVNLAAAVPGPWSHASFFGPYTRSEDMAAALGFNWPDAPNLDGESEQLVVLHNHRRVIAAFHFPEGHASGLCLQNSKIPRARAKFRVVRGVGRSYLNGVDLLADLDSLDGSREIGETCRDALNVRTDVGRSGPAVDDVRY